MVTPAELESWQPSSLTDIAESILSHRRTLTALDDDLLDGRPPASWTFADGDAARTTHDTLTAALATQVSETTGVIDALDAAAAAITTAKSSLAGAKSTARSYGMTVDPTTGAVRSTRTYEDDAERADARLVLRDLATQITSALNDAQAADDALAAALTTASSTDTNTLGTLTQQRELAEFEAKTPSQQVQYLLDHPEAYAFLGEHVSPEVKAQLGEELADDLDALARDAQSFTNAGTVDLYNGLLGAFGADPAVMGPMYDRLGPDGLLGTFNNLASALPYAYPPGDLEQLVGRVRDGLATATQQPGFDGRGFGEELVTYATGTVTTDQSDAFADSYPSAGLHAAVLDYVMRDGAYSEDFVRGVAWKLDDFERTWGADTVEMWMYHNGDGSPLNVLGVEDPMAFRRPDPMAATMGQLGNHPELGLEFFTEDDWRATHYIGERDWSRDGYEGIARAGYGIGTDPGNLTAERHDTGMFVSRFVDQLANNPEFTADNAAAGAEPVANLLKHYMIAVEQAVSPDLPGDFGPKVVTLHDAYGPQLDDYPSFDLSDVDALMKVALTDPEGIARIAEGVGGLRAAQLDRFVELHGAQGAQANQMDLNRILSHSAALEGHIQLGIGTIAVDDARVRDQQVAAFSSIVSEAAGMVPLPYSDQIGEAVGDLGTKAVEYAWGQVQAMPSEQVDDVFGGNVDSTVLEQQDKARIDRAEMVVGTYLSLVQSGLVEVPPHLAEAWAPGGTLISLDGIRPEDLGDRYNDAAVEMGSLVSEAQLDSMYRLRYLDPTFG